MNLNCMKKKNKAVLRLENGMEFEGFQFGSPKASDGEVVFSTAMVGYPESLTDPSYSGQILCVTYPLIGNYGVPDEGLDEVGISKFLESEKIWANGLIISEYSFDYSHWNAVKSLDAWLEEQNVPGIYGIDTRALTQVLRENGSMLGMIVPEGRNMNFPVPDPNDQNLVAKVSCKEVIRYNSEIEDNNSIEKSSKKRVLLIDCGVKHNILRYLLTKDVEIIRVPWDYDFSDIDYDGILISNGPGNPIHCGKTIENIKKALDGDKPILGICLGNQLLALAAGAQTYKLKYGHRGGNQPVRLIGTNKCYITSQNHGYTVDANSLNAGWEEWFMNMNDGTNEGIRHTEKPFSAIQFHPETSTISTDTQFVIEDFLKSL